MPSVKGLVTGRPRTHVPQLGLTVRALKAILNYGLAVHESHSGSLLDLPLMTNFSSLKFYLDFHLISGHG